MSGLSLPASLLKALESTAFSHAPTDISVTFVQCLGPGPSASPAPQLPERCLPLCGWAAVPSNVLAPGGGGGAVQQSGPGVRTPVMRWRASGFFASLAETQPAVQHPSVLCVGGSVQNGAGTRRSPPLRPPENRLPSSQAVCCSSFSRGGPRSFPWGVAANIAVGNLREGGGPKMMLAGSVCYFNLSIMWGKPAIVLFPVPLP